MPQVQICYRIRPDGVVEEVVQGVGGSACQQLTERIEKRLGILQGRTSTAEAYQSQTVGTSAHQVQHFNPNA